MFSEFDFFLHKSSLKSFYLPIYRYPVSLSTKIDLKKFIPAIKRKNLRTEKGSSNDQDNKECF